MRQQTLAVVPQPNRRLIVHRATVEPERYSRFHVVSGNEVWR